MRVPGSWVPEGHSRVGPFITRETYRLEDGSRRRWSSRRHRKGHERLTEHTLFWQPRTLGWWIAVLFAIGSFLFALGVVPSYATAVGAVPDAWTFFVGSLFFTSAALLQWFEAVNVDWRRIGAADADRRWRPVSWEPKRIDLSLIHI